MGEPGKGMFWVIESSYKHLVDGTSPRRGTRSRQSSLADSHHKAPSPFVQIKPARRTVSMDVAPPDESKSAQTLLAPQLLEAAAALESGFFDDAREPPEELSGQSNHGAKREGGAS